MGLFTIHILRQLPEQMLTIADGGGKPNTDADEGGLKNPEIG